MGMQHWQRIGSVGSHESRGIAIGIKLVPYRKRLTPVSLAAEQPVAQTIVDSFFGETGFK